MIPRLVGRLSLRARLLLTENKDLDQAGHEAQEALKADPSSAAAQYTVWVEVNREYDFNASHQYPQFQDPALPDYGMASFGQPSVLYKVPIVVGGDQTSAHTLDYAGYGSHDGSDGNIRPPDSTITTNVAGSGAGRLAVISDGAGDYRVRVTYRPGGPDG